MIIIRMKQRGSDHIQKCLSPSLYLSCCLSFSLSIHIYGGVRRFVGCICALLSDKRYAWGKTQNWSHETTLFSKLGSCLSNFGLWFCPDHMRSGFPDCWTFFIRRATHICIELLPHVRTNIGRYVRKQIHVADLSKPASPNRAVRNDGVFLNRASWHS